MVKLRTALKYMNFNHIKNKKIGEDPSGSNISASSMHSIQKIQNLESRIQNPEGETYIGDG